MGTNISLSTAVSFGLNQGWHLLHDVQRDVLVSFVFHAEPLHDLHLVTLLLPGLPGSCFYFLNVFSFKVIALVRSIDRNSLVQNALE